MRRKYEIWQSPHKSFSGLFYLFHALMLVNIAVTIGLKAVPDWEMRKSLSLPMLPYSTNAGVWLHTAATSVCGQ